MEFIAKDFSKELLIDNVLWIYLKFLHRKTMRKYINSNTLYFFPAFLPLAELVPWLLTLLGTVAGLAGFSHSAFWVKYRKLIIGGSILCFGVAICIVIMALPNRETKMEGTRQIPEQDLPVTKIYQQINENKPISHALPLNEFGKIWTINTNKSILTTPVISGSLLLYGSYEGTVEAISLDNGEPVWSINQRSPILKLNQGENGIIYVGDGTHDTKAALLTAIDTSHGRVLWSREFLGHIEEYAGFDNANHRMWIGSGPGGLWAINSHNGNVLWHKPIGHVDSNPLFVDGRLFVPADTDEKNHSTALFALNADNGKVIWQLPQPGQPWGSPLMDKTRTKILTTTGIGQIGGTKVSDTGWAYAVSPQGKTLWQVELSNMPLQPSRYLSDHDLIIHTLKNGEIIALHVEDGSTAWRVNGGVEFQTSATLITGFKKPMIASTSFGGIFTIRDALTGNVLAEQKVGTYVISSPIVSGDIIYVMSAHSITAFGGLHKLAEKE